MYKIILCNKQKIKEKNTHVVLGLHGTTLVSPTVVHGFKKQRPILCEMERPFDYKLLSSDLSSFYLDKKWNLKAAPLESSVKKLLTNFNNSGPFSL